MRIAQVAPLWELVPPRAYGGTELVVHNLTEELVRRGHKVTLFAASGTRTNAKLIACAPSALRAMEAQLKQDKTHCTVMGYELKMLQDVFAMADQFDVIHNHLGYQALPFANFTDTPVVTTLHNALEPEVVRDLFFENAHLPYISISNYQRKLWPVLNYAATIYHGIQMNRFKPSFEQNDKNYLAFLGRMSPEKGPHLAIQIARALDMKLLMAGKIDHVDRAFYEGQLAPLIDGAQIRYIGELDHEQKVELLRHAAGTLCPVLWPEPFGLVMIESMACGTPVFALRNGSIPEVVNHGKTGYVADSVEELTEAVRNWKGFDRQIIREIAERRFSREKMVDHHEHLYWQLAQLKDSKKLSTSAFESSLTPARIAEIKREAAQSHLSKWIPSSRK